MHFSDHAFVLSVRRHAETTGIVRVFGSEHGLIAGAVRGISGKNARGVWQPGNRALVTWSARLADQLGTLTGELTQSVAALVMQDAARLSALTSACTLMEMALPERHPYPALFKEMEALAKKLMENVGWQERYARFEFALLAETGFGLDLSACAATGNTEELLYVSPKSGRAVSRAAGEPYKEKLFNLPQFLLSPPPAEEGSLNASEVSLPEILASLHITGYFLTHWLLAPHDRTMPAARSRFLLELQRMCAHA